MQSTKQRTGETLSFTGFLTYCLARAVDEDKTIQAYRKGDKQLIMFDDVNVGMMVERKVGEKRALMGHVVRAANRKTYREIHDEIRKVQSEPVPPDRGHAQLVPFRHAAAVAVVQAGSSPCSV